jgi:hypothetical protein
MMHQLVQIVGSLGVLIPFLLVQVGLVQARTLATTVPNFLGSGVLAVDAGRMMQFGFLILEGSWALVSLVSAAAVLRSRRRPS